MSDGGTPVIEPDDLDLLSRRVLAGERVVEVRRLTGGFSNDNVVLRTTRGGSYVLRCYPRRNACAIEAALMDLLAGRVPVPEVVYADASGDLLGEPFMLTRFVRGVPLSTVFAGSNEEDGPRLAQEVAEALAAVGSVRFKEPGFFAVRDGSLTLGAAPPEHHADLPAFVEACLARTTADTLTGAERAALLRYAERCAPLVAPIAGSDELVHSDFNSKNVLMCPGEAGTWQVSAILDWEYAYSGCALADLGNLLRFPEDLPPGFEEHFPGAYEKAGGVLSPEWRAASEALDLFALADLLTRSPGHPMLGRAVTAVRRHLAE